ncbi:hypothetical protein A374_07599 [Fictibacillus macauensis ZFHKF-1]|uniref:Uncharacterized protein n=1 Tax=Fictibacillus macauensis ZFHKF-1 TaxID=1196324 RepID=I8UFT6_9BACL|nr:hypothetical protein [Fictibacillus macauensis]EIT85683.1 hypothetical protein A374_07599 [Fictibacillus macauensis ZFHKF-1]
MNAIKNVVKRYPGLELSFLLLSLFLAFGLYETVIVYQHLALVENEFLIGLTPRSFTLTWINFALLMSILWTTALPLLDWAHQTALFHWKNVLFGTVFIFIGVPVGLSFQLDQYLLLNKGINDVTEALLITVLISFTLVLTEPYRNK